MIGFNRNGFAGLTASERNDKKETMEYLKAQAKYLEDFDTWESNHLKKMERVTARAETAVRLAERFAIFQSNLFWFCFSSIAFVFFLLGWTAHPFFINHFPRFFH